MDVERVRGLVFLKNHGSFRSRTSFFAEPGMRNGSTPMMQRIMSATSTDASREETIWGSDLRFRYEPQLHISAAFDLHFTADALKDMRLGSSPGVSPQENLDVAGGSSLDAPEDATRDNISVSRL